MAYQSTRADIRRAYTIGVVYVILAILGIMLFKIWPPVPWPLPSSDADFAKLAVYIGETGCPQPPRTTPATTTTANEIMVVNPDKTKVGPVDFIVKPKKTTS